MPVDAPLTVAQHVVQASLLLVAAIAMFGGSVQLILGQPDTSPRLDNVHRFMAGVYLSVGQADGGLARLSHPGTGAAPRHRRGALRQPMKTGVTASMPSRPASMTTP